MSRGDDHWIVDLRSTHMGTFDAPAGWEAVAECVCGWQARDMLEDGGDIRDGWVQEWWTMDGMRITQRFESVEEANDSGGCDACRSSASNELRAEPVAAGRDVSDETEHRPVEFCLEDDNMRDRLEYESRRNEMHRDALLTLDPGTWAKGPITYGPRPPLPGEGEDG